MERVITMKLNVDTKSAVSSLDDFEEEAKNAGKAVDDIGKGGKGLDPFQQKLDEVNKKVKSGELDFRQLRKTIQDYQSIALAAGRESPVGQQALEQAAALRDQLVDLDAEVKRLSHDGANLQAAMQLGSSVVAGFSAFKGVTAALGVENEDLQKTLVKLQGAQAALMGIEQLRANLEKESFLMIKAKAIQTKALTALQLVYNTVVGKSNGLLKLFKLALASTGIGLIIVGIGLLIANFEKVTEVVGVVTDAIKEFIGIIVDAAIRIGEFFGFVAEGTADQIQLEKKAADDRRKNHQAWGKQLQARIDGLKAERKAQEEAHKDRQSQFDLDIERLDALGQASEDLKLKKLEDLQAELQAQLQFIIDSGKAWEAYYEKLRAERGQSRDEFIAAMKAQGVDLEKLQGQQQGLIDELENKIFSSESKIISFKRQMREKDQAEADKANKDKEAKEAKHYAEMQRLADEDAKARAKAADKLFNERQAIADRISEWERGHRFDKFQIEMDDLRQQFKDEMDLFIGNEEMRAELTREFEANINAIKEEARLADAELEQEQMDARLEKISNVVESAGEALSKLSEINEIMNEIGERRKEKIQEQRDADLASLDAKTKKELSNQRLTEKQKILIEQKSKMAEFKIKKQAAEAEDKIARRQFQRNKAIKLAEVAVNTAAAVVQALGSFPPPASFIMAGITGGIGIAQAALIATQKFKGTAGSIAPPTFSAPNLGGGGGDSGSTTSSTNVTSGGGASTDDLLNRNQRVVVSQVEINEQRDNLANVEEVATIG